MNLVAEVFKNYTQASSDRYNNVRNQIVYYITNTPEGNALIRAIAENPDNIQKEIFDNFAEYCHRISNVYNSVETGPHFLSFSAFEKASQDYNEAENEHKDDTQQQEVEEKKLPTNEEQLNQDIEEAGEEPNEPDLEDLVEEDVDDSYADDESESGLTANLKYIETSAIKSDKFDWYRFTGARKKKYTYGKSTWTLAPNGIVGISKACDFRNKHSLCILDQSKNHTIDLSKHCADLLKKKCKPFTGNIANIITPTPGSRRVATANVEAFKKYNEVNAEPHKSLEEISSYIDDNYRVSESEEGIYEFEPKDIDKQLAKKEMVKYLSNLFKVEPIENDEEDTHWDTSDGQIILKYQPDFKYVVSVKK